MIDKSLLDFNALRLDVQLILPEVVNGNTDQMRISYGDLVPALINAVKESNQELKSTYEDLIRRVERLEKE